MKPYSLTIYEASRLVRAGEMSPVELTESTLDRIEEVEPAVSAFVDVYRAEALQDAKFAEQELRQGKYRSPLHGLPVALKDLYDVSGKRTSASSKVRFDHVADDTATAVRLLKAAGAIVLGKTQCDEFAFGTTTPNTRNPWDTRYVPGGSSGGSGAAVASGECLFALGTDTGGSIRGPATLCGVVGLKPTYGRVSTYGVTPCSWSFDHAGPLTRTVRDAALVLQALARYDMKDPQSLDAPVPDYTAGLNMGIEGLRIGRPQNYYFDDVHPEVAHGLDLAFEEFVRLGANVREVQVPLAELYMAVLFGIIVPEASLYQEEMMSERAHLYTENVRRIYEAGSLMLARDYIQSLRARQMIKGAWQEVWDDIDVIVAPTHPAPAALAGQESFVWPSGNEEAVIVAYSRLTGPANILGIPSMSVPCGITAAGMPFGLQIMGKPLDEATLLRVGEAYQSATRWHTKLPLEGVPREGPSN